MKTSLNGDSLWFTSLGHHDYDGISTIYPQPDGEIVAVGWVGRGFLREESNPTIWEISPEGEEMWRRTFDFDTSLISMNGPASVLKSADSIYIAGSGYVREDFHQYGVLLLATLNGDSLWSREYDLGNDTYFRDIALAIDDGLIIAGGSTDGTAEHAALLRVNFQGDSVWLWLSPTPDISVTSVIVEDSTYLVVGNRGEGVAWFARIDSTGNQVSTEEYEIGANATIVRGWKLSGGHVFVAGYTYSTRCMNFRLDQDLQQVWYQPYGEIQIKDMIELNDHSYIYVGYNAGIWISQTTPDIVSTVSPNYAPRSFTLHPAYPNPFNPTTTLTFDVQRDVDATLKAYDVLGNEVATLVDGRLSAGTHTVEFKGNELPSGIYFCRLQAGTFSQTQKLMLLK